MAGDKVISYRSTGSNTAASGCGPATAVTGSNAFSGDGAGGGTQTDIDLSGDTPDLSAVQAGDILFIDTGSGSTDRHLFEITAVNDTTDIVSVKTAPTTSITSGAPKSWAIGGTRLDPFYKSSATRADWNYVEYGWTLELESGQTYNLTVAYPNSTDDTQWHMRSSTYGTRAKIVSTADGLSFRTVVCSWIHFDWTGISVNMDFICWSGAAFYNCKFSNYTRTDHIRFDANVLMFCEFFNIGTATTGIYFQQNGRGVVLDSCTFNDCGTVRFIAGNFIDVSVRNCINLNSVSTVGAFQFLHDTAGDFIHVVFSGNTIVGSAGDAFYFNSTADTTLRAFSVFAANNIVTDAGGYAFNFNLGTIGAEMANSGGAFDVGYNQFNNNTSGNYNGVTSWAHIGHDDQTGDPVFTSTTAGAEDLSLQSTSPCLDDALEAPAIPQS